MVGEGFVAYRGSMTDATAHRHAAFQLLIAPEGVVSVVDSLGSCHRAAALVVRPMALHRTLGTPNMLNLFIDPHCAMADELRSASTGDVTPVTDLRHLNQSDVRLSASSRHLDHRLMAAMQELTISDTSIQEVAANVGLSSQRLGALARHQLDMPLSRWRVWSRLRRTAAALSEGQPLALAAVTGGFADQSHLSRWMREMMGVTPRSAALAIRGLDTLRGIDGDRTGEG
jgi:AraC-like DNA-binding protein